MSQVTLLHGDCLEVMPTLPANSVQMVFADLPYGCTENAWDIPIPLDKMWPAILAVATSKAGLVFTGKQPFTSSLVMSNRNGYSHCWVWHKFKPTGFLAVKRRPLSTHEDIVVFNRSSFYYPQGLVPVHVKNNREKKSANGSYNKVSDSPYVQKVGNFPRSVLTMQQETRPVHGTQKPVALLEYLVKTYTRPGETVLDFCAGSGTTAIAALRTGRNVICIEKDAGYYEVMCNRVAAEQKQMRLAV